MTFWYFLWTKCQTRIRDPWVEFVRGFFNESFAEATFRLLPFRPARYVDIDVDLYSSTIQVLEWLLTSGILVPGTVIYYDDWLSGGHQGNQRAHQETFAKFPGFQVRHRGKHSWLGCFIVTEVPSAPALWDCSPLQVLFNAIASPSKILQTKTCCFMLLLERGFGTWCSEKSRYCSSKRWTHDTWGITK